MTVEVKRALEAEIVKILAGALNKRAIKILKMRLGIDVGYPRTLEEVGQYFGVSRERIRQLEERALDDIGEAGEKERFAGLTQKLAEGQ